ncbi:MAG: hypothetical protein A2144_02355 [Chloroflexi bacterium RBG_16_50_9]|nr:MAG: hypothetical protein A2144_02355 [Chloroflexi bacterium RBG_16_50_9]
MKNKRTTLDSIDLDLLQVLQEDARLTSDELARKINVSATTIRRRIRNLIRNDIIRIVAIADPKKIGLSTVVGIHLELNPRTADRAAEELARYKSVRSVSLTTGRFNCMALAVFPSTDDFQNFMRTVISNLEGLTTVETHIFLEFKKGKFIHGD